ncbi:phosphonate C-P lyase system protein PhnH [Roseibium algae]|uniref:Phosphonate C-P lyase system protein PhnH n=1 Tax=Roseibium algae TaxID=3123038 RepID=A0ABU8TQB6_9HYPH
MLGTQTHSPAAAVRLAPGFSNPVHDAQNCFRAVMQAIARPGSLQPFAADFKDLPDPLTAMGAALALTLLDFDTPVWLDPALASSPDATAFLRFHTGAPIVNVPVEASFCLISDPERLIGLGNFAQGTPDYPDRSATLILMRQTFNTAGMLQLTGPGIKDVTQFGTSPVPQTFWDQVKANNAQFPRGIDLIFAGETEIAALPRSTQLTRMEA